MPRAKGSMNKNHKEKPHKEKKQRGRPRGSIKQKQNQHQIVNVTVNNGDGGGGGDKKRAGPIPLPPLNIFDPSLITPHYGVNDRQPVNPPDPENVDMTELLTRLTAQFQPTQPLSNNNISVQNKNEPAKVEPAKVEPSKVEPSKVEPPEPPIKIKEPPIKIKEPPIKIKPNDIQEPKVQTVEYKQKLKELKKIADKEIHKNTAYYKDPEKLGMKIPVGNIAAIGSAFLGGAGVGAATLATEAAIVGTGAAIEEGSLLAGLSTAKEAMSAKALLSASIGGGVGASVNEALGGGPAAHIISGVAGGVASRQALKRYDQKQAAKQRIVAETQPLLGGNVLGGRDTKRSNLLPPSPEKAVTTSHEPEQSMMEKVKEITKQKAQEAKQQVQNIGEQISNGVQKIRQRISGRTKADSRGTYARIPDNPMGEDAVSYVDNPNDEVQLLHQRFSTKEQNEAASIIQSHMKKRTSNKARMMIERDDDINEQIKNAAKPPWKQTIDQVKQKRKNKEYMDSLKQQQNLFYSQQPTNDKDKIKALSRLQAAVKRNYTMDDYKYHTVERPKIIQKRQQELESAVLGNDMTSSRPAAQNDNTVVYSTKSNMGPPKPRVTRPPILEQYREALSSTPITGQAPELETEMKAGYKIAAAAKRAVRQRNKSEIKSLPLSEYHELDKRGVTPIYEAGTGDSTLRAMRNSSAITLQNAARNRTAKRAMMKQTQLVREAELKQMEAAKDKTIKDNAAAKLQGTIKRKTAQNDIAKIKKSVDKIGSSAKRLMTERANSYYSPKFKATTIWNEKTVGQPLAVSRTKKLVSKKKHDAAVEGYQNRLAFLDVADKYKDVMKGGKK